MIWSYNIIWSYALPTSRHYPPRNQGKIWIVSDWKPLDKDAKRAIKCHSTQIWAPWSSGCCITPRGFVRIMVNTRAKHGQGVWSKFVKRQHRSYWPVLTSTCSAIFGSTFGLLMNVVNFKSWTNKLNLLQNVHIYRLSTCLNPSKVHGFAKNHRPFGFQRPSWTAGRPHPGYTGQLAVSCLKSKRTASILFYLYVSLK